MTHKGERLTLGALAALCLLGAALLGSLWQQAHRRAAYADASTLCAALLAQNPALEPQLAAALKAYADAVHDGRADSAFLARYGYDVRSFPTSAGALPAGTAMGIALGLCGLLGAAWAAQRAWMGARIRALTRELEQVNAGALGTLTQGGEDALAHLQDELGKTVTALRTTRDAAVQARARFADNLANIAHQLKTPLTAAMLHVQLWAERSPGAQAEAVRGQLARIAAMEEALLTLSRVDSGALVLQSQRVDLYTALCLAAENLQALSDARGVSIAIPERECVTVQGDMAWLVEALMNLMKNALEHAPRGSAVHCNYARNPLYAQVRICDEGAGFDPADLPHLFERFYRGRNATGDGVGIGLALADALITQQGGSLSAFNRPQGGACFEVRLYCH